MHNEQVFTPKNIVNLILDEIGYVDYNSIRFQYIIDNSCGDGAFLTEIVRRYIDVCKRKHIMDWLILKELTRYIVGIEIDEALVDETLNNLDKVVAEYEFYDPNGVKYENLELDWRVYLDNSLDIDVINEARGGFDYVVGNPPYCNVHHLGDNHSAVKAFSFASDGASDLYLAFYNIGLEMLRDSGKLAYITPNSWMKGVMGRNFRKYIKESGNLSKIIQFGSEKIFKDATTFTAITILDKSKNSNDFVYQIGSDIFNSSIDNAMISDGLYLADENELLRLKEINEGSYHKMFTVKNGFATLNDKLFVVKDSSNYEKSENLIRCVKASTGEECLIIFPYDNNGKPLEFDEIDENARNVLESRATNDLKSKDKWFLYGRTQALLDVCRHKVTANTIVKTVDDIKLNFAAQGEGVYSGLYVISDDDRTLSLVDEFLKNDDFIEYVKLVGKHKNGGYYTFNSKDLEKWLNYKYSQI